MGESIRILQIVTQMNRAGLESRLMDIYRNIDRSRLQFDFYTCRNEKGFFDDEIIAMGGKVFFSDPITIKTFYKIPKCFKQFLLEHQEYKIVHCHLNQWCGLILKGAKEASVPVRIAHSRTSLETKSIRNLLKNIIKLSVNKNATHRFAVSKKAGNWLFGNRAIRRSQVVIWPNAIDCNKYRYNPNLRKLYRKTLGLGNSFTLIHVGNLRPEKNHKFLLQIFAQLKQIFPNVKLILIGADGMNGACEKLASRLKIDSDVLFLGARSDVAALLQAGDVFVFPSFYEGFPGAVLEAQAAGLPCIISDTITDEVCVTERIFKLSISLSADEWAKAILSQINQKRVDTYSVLDDAGYDIHSLATKMRLFYEQVYKGENYWG